MNERRPRGRPSDNSREKIIQVARDLLIREPEKPLTMAKVAKELGLVTMALYKHVKNKDDLLEGVADLVFSECKLEPTQDEDWSQQLENWAIELRRFFHDNPFIRQIIGWELHISRAWLSLSASLTRILREQGLSEAELAINVQWFTRTLMAYLMLELAQNLEASSKTWIEHSQPAIDQLNEDDRANLNLITPTLSQRSSDDEFAYFLERTIASLQLVLSN